MSQTVKSLILTDPIHAVLAGPNSFDRMFQFFDAAGSGDVLAFAKRLRDRFENELGEAYMACDAPLAGHYRTILANLTDVICDIIEGHAEAGAE